MRHWSIGVIGALVTCSALSNPYIGKIIPKGAWNEFPFENIGGFYLHNIPQTPAVSQDIRGSTWIGFFSKDAFYMQGDILGNDRMWEVTSAQNGGVVGRIGNSSIRSRMFMSQFDCKNMRSKFLQAIAYDGYWTNGNVVSFNNEPTDWIYPVPGSRLEFSLTVACERLKVEKKIRARKK